MLLSALYRMVPSSSFRSRAVFTVDLTKEPSSLEAESQEQMKQRAKLQIEYLPSRELTYPTLGKGKSSSNMMFDGIC